MARITFKDLQPQENELSAQEMNNVVGGRIQYRRWKRYAYRTQRVGYRYVTAGGRKRRVPVYRRIRLVQNNMTASGTNYGSWRRG